MSTHPRALEGGGTTLGGFCEVAASFGLRVTTLATFDDEEWALFDGAAEAAATERRIVAVIEVSLNGEARPEASRAAVDRAIIDGSAIADAKLIL